MTHDEPSQRFQPHSMFSTWIGVVLLFAFFGLLALVVIGASTRGNTYEEKRAEERARKLQTVHDETTKALTTYAWVDKTKGVVQIPITDAMRLTVAELSQRTPAPANPIAVPDANPPPQSAASVTASPAPSATAGGTPKPTSVSGPNSEGRNQPAAVINPPPAPPGTQPGPSKAPGASLPSPAVKALPPSSATPSAPGTPLPIRGKN